jgi:hypothetical protein
VDDFSKWFSKEEERETAWRGELVHSSGGGVVVVLVAMPA